MANKTSSGTGFTSLLLLTFIILKLCNIIDWSWFWVLSPAWIPVALMGLLFIMAIIVNLSTQGKDRKMRNGLSDERCGLSKWEHRVKHMQEQQRIIEQRNKGK